MDNSLAPLDSPQLCPTCGKVLQNVAPGGVCPYCRPAQVPDTRDEQAGRTATLEFNKRPSINQTESSPQTVASTSVSVPLPELLPFAAAPEPTHAASASHWQRFRNWTRDNPVLAGFSAIVLLLLCIGVALRSRPRHAEVVPVGHAVTDNRERFVQTYVGNGTRLLAEGDNFGSLVWFAEALKLDRGIAGEEANDRLRIGSVLRQSPKLLQVWYAGAPINSAEFSRDGRLVLAAVHNNAVWIWNTKTGQAQNSPLIHKGDRPIEAHFSPDGATIVSAAGDSVCLWSATTGKLLRTLPHLGAQHAVFNLEGDLLATASRDGSVKIWPTANGGAEAVRTLPHKRRIVSLCFTPDSNGLLTGEEGGSVHIWDLETGQSSCAEKVPGWKPPGELRYAAFDYDGSRVVTIHAGGSARVWDSETGAALTPVLRESTALTHATFSPDAGWLATSAEGGSVKVWNTESGAQAQLSGHKDAVTQSSFSPSGQRVATASLDGTARIFESATGKVLTPPLRHGGPVTAVQFHPDGQRLLTGSSDGTVRIWSLWPERQLLPFSDELGPRVIAVTPDRTAAVVQDSAYSLQVWDAASWKPNSVLMPAGNLVTYACLSDDRKHVLSAAPTRGTNGFDFVVKTWEVASGKEISCSSASGDYALNPLLATYDCKRIALRRGKVVELLDAATGKALFPALNFPDRPSLLRFSPESRYLMVVAGCNVQTFDVTTGNAIFSPLNHSCAVSDAVFSHDGKRILTSCSDDSVNPGQAQLWDALTGKALGKPMKHTAGVLHASFSPDDSLVLTASKDNSARIWDASTGQAIGSPLRHPVTVNDSAFSPDARRIATASQDKSARVWDAKTGDLLTAPLKHNQFVDEALLLPGGEHLLTRSILKMRVWELASDNRPVADLQMLAQVLSGRRIDGAGASIALEPSVLAASWNELYTKHPDDFAFEQFDARRKIGPRDSHADATLIDLGSHYNALLTEPRHVGASANDFAALPQGLQTYSGTAFDVRGVVQLAGGDLVMYGGRPLPEAVQQIRVDQSFSRVHLLHGASFYERDRTAVAYLRLHYEDGKVQQLPIFAGIDVEGSKEWAQEKQLTRAELVWPNAGAKTPRNRSQPARLYKSSWDNPISDVPVKSIDYVSTLSRAAPYLIAITIEP